jgi:AbiV family abortive infection protein
MNQNITHTRRLCLEQAKGLIEAAECLNRSSDWPHLVYHLSLLALEEVGKAGIVSATAVRRADSDEGWISRSLENHRRKLQWAIWSPLTRIDPEDFEAAWRFAERAHAMRLASLYVDADADQTDPPPKEQIKQEDADQVLELARARLSFEMKSEESDEKVIDELTDWFLDAMADVDQARTLLSSGFRSQYEQLGGNARAWVRWARDEIAKLDVEASELLKLELAKPGSASESAKAKWRANATVYTPSHSLRAKVLAILPH